MALQITGQNAYARQKKNLHETRKDKKEWKNEEKDGRKRDYVSNFPPCPFYLIIYHPPDIS